MNSERISFGDRIMSLLASLVFSIPTAMFVWFGLNVELSFLVFIESTYMWGAVGVFSIIAFIFPRLFPSIIGKVWHGIVKVTNQWWY